MTPRFILITTAAILLAGCDRRSAEAVAAKAAEISAQRQAEQAANDKIRQLEDRLNAADQQKAADREAELARVKDELAQIKKDKDAAADRIRELQNEADKPAPAPVAEAPRNEAIRADLERVVEEDDEDTVREESDPVYVGRVVPETQRVTNVESFYEPLDQYGDWIQTDDYGYVFRPEVSRRHDWRPYTDGRWVHTGHGWAWDSNEDFGWATYHYGRWTRIERAGWVWVPGREWGPGWVSWRRGKDECGWAPLPPESRGRHSFTASVDRDYGIGPAAYVFISLSNFGARSYAPIIERPERNVTIINKTVNVTNITYNNTTNNTVVYNGGPSYDVIRARSKQPVENVKVNFVPQAPAGDRRKIVNLRQGNTFQIAAPPVTVAANTAPPRVKEKLGKTKEEKGWEGVDPAQAGKLKQEVAATSTDRPRRPRPAGGVANPNAPKPVVPVVATPPTVPARPAVTPPATTPARPERPVVAPPDAGKPPIDPAKPPQIAPKPETPARPAIVDKPRPLDPDAVRPKPTVEVPPKVDRPDAPQKPADSEPPKMREPEPARPKPAPEVSPIINKPEEPKKPIDAVPPKMREPENTRPRPTPEPQPKLDPSERPKRVGDDEPRRFREVEKPATPNPVRELPKRPPATPPAPVVRERPQPVVPNEAPARPKADAPVRVKPPVDAPVRVRPVNPERPVPEPVAPRSPQVERRQVAPQQERPAQVTRPVEQPVRRVVQPERPPQEMRAPASRPVQQEIPRERVQRQAPPAPVVQRPPQQQAAPQNVQPAKNSKEADERKKKKDGEQ